MNRHSVNLLNMGKTMVRRLQLASFWAADCYRGCCAWLNSVMLLRFSSFTIIIFFNAHHLYYRSWFSSPIIVIICINRCHSHPHRWTTSSSSTFLFISSSFVYARAVQVALPWQFQLVDVSCMWIHDCAAGLGFCFLVVQCLHQLLGLAFLLARCNFQRL